MGRASVGIVIFFVCLSAFANVLVVSGAADGLGLSPNPDGGETTSGSYVNDSTGSARNVSSGGHSGGTIVPLVTQSVGILGQIIVIVFRGPIMLTRIGLPSWFTLMVVPGITIIAGVDLLYGLSGRDF